MGLYRYEAVDGTGKTIHGVMNASDEQQVSQKLLSMGYTLRAIHSGGNANQPAASRTASAVASRPSVKQSGGIQAVTIASGVPVSVKPSVSLPELARFFRTMATLVKSGISLNQALSQMAPVVRNPRLRPILGRMQESTQAGNKLSGMMAEYPKIFPVHAIASVWSGELAGKLEIALEEVASDLEREAADTRFGRIGWGLTKLHWIFFLIILPMANITVLLTPVLNRATATGGEMSQSESLRLLAHTYFHDMFPKTVAWCVVFVLLWILWGFLKRIPSVRYMLDAAMSHAPLWGTLHKDRAKARFLHVLDQLYSAGIGPAAAWDAASLTPKNSYIAGRLRDVKSQVSPNAGMAEMFAASGVFDADDVAFASTGEKSGTLPEVLMNLSSIYDERASAKKTTGKTTSVILLMVFCSLLAIYLVFGMAISYRNLANIFFDWIPK